MLDFEILRYRYLIFALAGGTGFLLAFVLAYLAMWRPRETGGAGETPASRAGKMPATPEATAGPPPRRGSFVPWILIVLAVGTLAFMVIYTWAVVTYRPQW